MIEFYDLSHWNTERHIIDAMKDDVVALKATEGATFTDKSFLRNASFFTDKILIAYHFLRASANAGVDGFPEREVDNFLSALKKLNRPVIMAIDFESPYSNSVGKDLKYLLNVLRLIVTKTGKEPYVYINQSQLLSAEKQGFKFNWLWIAKWSKTPPAHDCGIWQYTNNYNGNKVDRNKFMVDDIELLKRHAVEVK